MRTLTIESDTCPQVAAASRISVLVAWPRMLGRWAALVLALMTPVSALSQNTYRDPEGNFSLEVPAGWQTQSEDNHGISVVNERLKASVSVFVMRSPGSNTPSPDKELGGIRGQLEDQCPKANLARGGTTVAGLRGTYLRAECNDNADEMIQFDVVSGPGVMLIVNSAAPAANLARAEGTMNSIERSISLSAGSGPETREMNGTPGPDDDSRRRAAIDKACSNGALTPEECAERRAELDRPGHQPGADHTEDSPRASRYQQTIISSNDPNWIPGDSRPPSSAVFRDSQGRYSLTVPEGWNARPESDGSGTLQLQHGSAWATLTLMESAGDSASKPADVVHGILEEMQPHYREPQLVGEGDFDNNRHQAHGCDATGIDEKGEHVAVTVISIQARGRDFLSVVSSAPERQADEVKKQMMQMVRTIRFSGE